MKPTSITLLHVALCYVFRGESGPGLFVFFPVENKPEQCLLVMYVATDLKVSTASYLILVTHYSVV